uniref:Tyrosine-protein kinase receptor Tie-1 n=1 Tax=Cacopsylla melanoneura TaxID=428564 RepID=A0A8D8XUC6_9HEMI
MGHIFLTCLFTCVILTSLSKGELTDVTTIYQVLNLNSDPSNEPSNPLCHVSIHSGSESRYLPYLINNELVFPKVSSLQDGKVKSSVKHNLDVDYDLNNALLFDSNNHTNTRWTFDNTRYRISDLSTTHANHDEPLYSKLIKQIRVKFILNGNDYESLKEIVANKSGRSTNATTSNEEPESNANIPDIIHQSELFHHQCKACRVDLYKLNNQSSWDLKLMGNFDYEKEDSVERSMEYEDDGDFTDGGQSQSRTGLGHISTQSDSKQTVSPPYLRSNTRQPESPVEQISLPYTNQLLFTYNLDNENEAILKPKLTSKEQTKYVLKVEFKVQSYFKMAFLINNSTDKDDYELIEITIRGACNDVTNTLETSYFVDISTGSDFRSWSINGTNTRHQTITFLFKSREYVYMQVGLVDHRIELHGARLSQVEVIPICFDNGFGTFQYELYDSTFSYFSLDLDRTKFFSVPAGTPSLTSPWIVPGGNELCLTILYTGATSDESSYEYACFNENNMSKEISVKVEQKLAQVTTTSDALTYCVERNGHFVRMIINHNESLTASSPPAYRFLVTISFMVKLRLIYASNCAADYGYPVKHAQDTCDAIEKVAYDVAYHHNYNKQGRGVRYCANLGKHVQGSCVCPPGFSGDHCEESCGADTFGVDCSGKCPTNSTTANAESVLPSLSQSAAMSPFCQGPQCGNNASASVASSHSCRGALLCTHYGCVCAPGYHGKYCSQHCTQGYYGNECKARCGQCAGNTACNIYTGHCTEGCATAYLIAPYCQHSYPYVTRALQVLNMTHFSILLRVDTHPNYIKGHFNDDNTSYWYMIQGRSLSWNTMHSSSKFLLDFSHPNSTSRDVWIENLVPGEQYSFQIVLYDTKDNRTHDPHSAPVINVTTECIHSDYEYAYQTETTSTSMQLYWGVRNINYVELMNRSIQELKAIYKKQLAKVTTVDTLNRLLTKYNTSLEDVEELFNQSLNIVYRVFECKRRHYNVRVRKINGQRGQKVKIKHIESGFQLKDLDPGHAYFVNLYWEDNNRTMKDIFRGILRTKNEVSEMSVKSAERGNLVLIKWNSTDPRVDKSKSSRSDSRTNPPPKNSNKSKPSELSQTVYYIKYRINQQQACLNKTFNDNWNVQTTTKTEYELKLNYFTKYSVFVTLNKGQTWATKYLNISVPVNVPEIAPGLLHVKDVTDHSARLAWADISLSNYECARLNGVFTEYELELIDLARDTISVYNQTSGFSQEVDGLTPHTEYGVKLRYVNHFGKNPAVFAYVQFETL